MFTGIIEEVGQISNINKTNDLQNMSIRVNKILNDAKVGDSISVNGTCLTITAIVNDIFTVDIVQETLERTNLKFLNIKNYINLERAMKASSRFDGHIVQGHVEGTAKILSMNKSDDNCVLSLELPEKLTKYCIYKGSIALNGVSLTIAKKDKNIIDIWLIPHTLKHTTFTYNKVGDYVNVETDIIGKYIENFQKSEI
jgi:riboflavin synthase